MVVTYRQAMLPRDAAITILAIGIEYVEMAELFAFAQQLSRPRQSLSWGRLPVRGKWRKRRVAVQAGGPQRIVGGQEIWLF